MNDALELKLQQVQQSSIVKLNYGTTAAIDTPDHFQRSD
jgi:hypothetical protein